MVKIHSIKLIIICIYNAPKFQEISFNLSHASFRNTGPFSLFSVSISLLSFIEQKEAVTLTADTLQGEA